MSFQLCIKFSFISYELAGYKEARYVPEYPQPAVKHFNEYKAGIRVAIRNGAFYVHSLLQ